MRIVVSWMEVDNDFMVRYRRADRGIILVISKDGWHVSLPQEEAYNRMGITLPMSELLDPRYNDPQGVIEAKVRILSAYAWYQAVLDNVRFFGAICNNHGNYTIGLGCASVALMSCCNPITNSDPTHFMHRIPVNFEVDVSLFERGEPLKEVPNRFHRDLVI